MVWKRFIPIEIRSEVRMGHLCKDDKVRKIIADIPKSTHQEFKIQCAKKGFKMKDVIEALITKFNEGKISVT